MLFAINYRRRANMGDEETQRLLRIFLAWSPPEGIELLAHYHYARGGAGIVLMRAVSAGRLYEALATFESMVDFDAEPVVSVIDAVAIKMDVDAWVDSLPAKSA